MAAAEVGDDVFDEDPTVHRLQRRVAELLGKEAALFMPSGTMSNQIALRLHCGLGDAFICEAGCHIYNYEQGAYAQMSGIAAQPVRATAACSRSNISKGSRSAETTTWSRRGCCAWKTRTTGAPAASCLTRACGSLPTGRAAIGWRCTSTGPGCSTRRGDGHFGQALGRAVRHGERVFQQGARRAGGLGLGGTKEHVQRARRHRKAFGGAMRQSGVLAAAALYALDHHIQRLAEDHQHARQLAATIRACPGLALVTETIDTNMVIFQVDPSQAERRRCVIGSRKPAS